MIDNVEIRESLPNDLRLIEELYPSAFPDEDLLPVVSQLLSAGPNVLSLVAYSDRALAGHVIFTKCNIVERAEKVVLLGPLAVAPDRQRQGVGDAIVRAGLERLKTAGVDQVYVLGDPAYYKRFGFEPDDRVAPPYSLPDDWRGAWQSRSLRDGKSHLQGKLTVPMPWREPALWAP